MSASAPAEPRHGPQPDASPDGGREGSAHSDVVQPGGTDPPPRPTGWPEVAGEQELPEPPNRSADDGYEPV